MNARLLAYLAIVIGLVMFLLTVDAPTQQQEAEDTAVSVKAAIKDAKKQASRERAEKRFEDEMKKRGCK